MQLRAEQTRRALLDVAATLFDARGLRGTGLLDIAQRAGVSKGALYFHFSNKEELVRTVVDEARAQAHGLARRHLGRNPCQLSDIAAFVTALTQELRRDVVLRAGLRLEKEAQECRQLHGGEDGEDGEGGSARLQAGRPTLLEEWMGCLRDQCAGHDGETALADLLTAVTVGLESLGRADPGWWTEDTVEGIWKLLCGMVPEESPAGRSEPG
ncbi:TetR family transcriptional regulator [Streptomyces boncukensis]|uniref:TetR/AcrR family transcriptional regulator n=1 Tax=Streptomyces boncukensis TaxID=2711219 RepID=A0A6G4WWE8_9ACTN|nr:TetR/AcrR family transcriptional regulator [Streptomyces boncukensis]